MKCLIKSLIVLVILVCCGDVYGDVYGDISDNVSKDFGSDGWVLEKEEYDTYDDGLIEGVILYSHDAHGNVVRMDDYSGYMIIKYSMIYAYDYINNVTKQEYDKYADGTIEGAHAYTYEYDSNKNIVKKRETYTHDKILSSDFTLIYTYDSNNNLIREEYDPDANGYQGTWYVYTYDSNNNLLKKEKYWNDVAGIFKIPMDTYTYDSNNNPIKIERNFDSDNDIPDYVCYQTYDSNNNLIKREEDTNYNGIIDRIKNFIYDTNNNLIKDEYIMNEGTIVRYYTWKELQTEPIVLSDLIGKTIKDINWNSYTLVITFTDDMVLNLIPNQNDPCEISYEIKE